ncbi:MAG: hypothetical protein QM529_02940, partial [Hydrotalea sp.]|nr:hypothetical protein [Hydrotalea sp.]
MPTTHDNFSPRDSSSDSFRGVYTIHASFGFAENLARRMVAIARTMGGDDWQIEMAKMTLYLPNRRSAGVVRIALLKAAQEMGSHGLLLPRIMSLGDIGDDIDNDINNSMDDNTDKDKNDSTDSDARLLADMAKNKNIDEMIEPLPLPTGRRLRILMTLIKAFYHQEFSRDITPGHLLALAKKLARFFDELTIAQQDKKKLFGEDVLAAIDDEEVAMMFDNN